MRFMKYHRILLFLLTGLLVNSCSKDKFQTKPKLTFKSASTERLTAGSTIQFNIRFTDAEGDIQDSIWVQKVTKNCANSNFSGRYKIPTFTATKNLEGEFEICFGYGINLGCPSIREPQCIGQNDTCVFRFWARDLAGNVSDTISSSTVIIVRR